MNRRGKRLTLGVMAVGLAVVLILAIAYHKPVLEHVEAWHFQLTRETRTIDPDTPSPLPYTYVFEDAVQASEALHALELNSGQVAIDRHVLLGFIADDSGTSVIFDRGLATGVQWYHVEECRGLTGDAALQDLGEDGWRIIEQRLPEKAYVVLHSSPSRVLPPEPRRQRAAGPRR